MTVHFDRSVFELDREPTSNFISSYRYYQYMMTSIWLDVGLRTIKDKKNPSTDVLYAEMEDFLQSFEHAEKVIRRIPPTSFARLGTYRSQLLYFGYYTDKVSSLTFCEGFRISNYTRRWVKCL